MFSKHSLGQNSLVYTATTQRGLTDPEFKKSYSRLQKVGTWMGMIFAALPAFFGLGLEHGYAENFLTSTVCPLSQSGLRVGGAFVSHGAVPG